MFYEPPPYDTEMMAEDTNFKFGMNITIGDVSVPRQFLIYK